MGSGVAVSVAVGSGVGVSVGGAGVGVSVGTNSGVGVLEAVGVTVGKATTVLARLGVFVGVGVIPPEIGPQARAGITTTTRIICSKCLELFTTT